MVSNISANSSMAEIAALNTKLEAAALTALDLLHVANRELIDNHECALSVVAAAERYLADVLAINEKLSALCTGHPGSAGVENR